MITQDRILEEFSIDNCRVCFDINDWRKRAQKSAFETPSKDDTPKETQIIAEAVPDEYQGCPPDAMELGRSTWTFLHTMSVYFPDKPTPEQQTEMQTFLTLFSKYYPCGYCASHLRKEMVKDPPQTESRGALARWLCRMHNEVNERLGKPMFDCERVEERWKTGPSDGRCG